MKNKETNQMINILDVCSITRQLCEQITGEKYAVIYETIGLMSAKDRFALKDYKTIVACKASEIQEVQRIIRNQEDGVSSTVRIPEKYCHITTFEREEEDKTGNISFDPNDGHPIQAMMDGEYAYVKNFFERFLKFRNNLIENGEPVKEDDIHQYFLFVTKGLNQKEKTSLLGKVKQLIKK